MNRLLVVTLALGSLIVGHPSAHAAPSLAGCPLFPADNVWNTPVDHLPVDSSSSAYIATIGSEKTVHPDFGASLWNDGPIGIPYTLVPGNQPRVNVSFEYDDESDPGPYPLPPDAAIEGGSSSTGDRHVLALDTNNCILYETFSSYPQPDGSWQAGSGAIFDLRSHQLRPSGWTSADAAGLPILPGLVRYEEVAAGEIRHALRFTAPQTQRRFVWPARHYASSLTSSQYPPMGKRFRLKANFNLSTFSPDVQVILRALKKYGMILADNGSAWYISGAPNPHWNDDVLVNDLKRVKGSDFEAVDESPLIVNADSGQARQPLGGPPVAATLLSPTESVATMTPTYTWNAVATATWYLLWVNDSVQSAKVQQWVTASQAGCATGAGECSFTPTTTLVPGPATWWVQTWSPSGYSPWSVAANFTVNVGPPSVATLVTPSGIVPANMLVYTWNAVPTATWYLLWVNDSVQSAKVQQWVTAAQAGCGAGTGPCSVTPSIPLTQGAATWWVQTWNPAGYGPWSNGMDFMVNDGR